MLRLTLIGLVALAGLGAVGVSAQGKTGHAAGRGPIASVRLLECARGPAADNRLAVYGGDVRRVPTAQSMWMRFKLQERVGRQAFRTVKAPGLGVWRKSRVGVKRFAYRQRVLALAEGSSYRTVVSFRWYAANGALTRQARRRSGPCRQPGRLPNLRVTRIGGGRPVPGAPEAVRYAVNVVNRGQVLALPFGVSLAVDGSAVDTQTVTNLVPGETRGLVFFGRACAGTVTAVADPDDAIRETTEKDNSMTSPCPSRR